MLLGLASTAGDAECLTGGGACRYAGMYVDDFRERRANATREHGNTPPDEELFDDLEHDLGIDLDAAVCSSAAAANYASRCCE